MQNLRDKLLKAGAIDKKKARKAKTEARREKKLRGGERSVEQDEKARAERFEQKKAAEAEATRQRQAELNAERERQAEAERLRNIIERHAQRKIRGDDCRFCFVGPDRRIRRLMTSFAVRDRLVNGELAIVSAPHDPARDYRLLQAEHAARIEALDPTLLLFWNKPGAEAEQPDAPTHGAQGPPR